MNWKLFFADLKDRRRRSLINCVALFLISSDLMHFFTIFLSLKIKVKGTFSHNSESFDYVFLFLCSHLPILILTFQITAKLTSKIELLESKQNPDFFIYCLSENSRSSKTNERN